MAAARKRRTPRTRGLSALPRGGGRAVGEDAHYRGSLLQDIAGTHAAMA